MGGKQTFRSIASPMFVIEDQTTPSQSPSGTRDEALAELQRLLQLPWDKTPNLAPCTSWRTCGRRYELVEYDTATTPWRELGRTPALEVARAGATWIL